MTTDEEFERLVAEAAVARREMQVARTAFQIAQDRALAAENAALTALGQLDPSSHHLTDSLTYLWRLMDQVPA